MAPTIIHSDPEQEIDWLAATRARGIGKDWVTKQAFADAEQNEALQLELNRHPELSWKEFRTTQRLMEELGQYGNPRKFKRGTGVIIEFGNPGSGRLGKLVRLDIDALPVEDVRLLPPGLLSTQPGVSHACGHDMHTAAGVGLVRLLHRLEREGRLPRPFRVVFQPAEEELTGAIASIDEENVLDGMGEVIGIHAGVGGAVGEVALSEGLVQRGALGFDVEFPAASPEEVSLPFEQRSGNIGGHSARPHLTSQVPLAISRVAALLGENLAAGDELERQIMVAVGVLRAGERANVIPPEGLVGLSARVMPGAWAKAKEIIGANVDEILMGRQVRYALNFTHETPPVVNHPVSTRKLVHALQETPLTVLPKRDPRKGGSDDLAWLLEGRPGHPGVKVGEYPTILGATGEDIHVGNFHVKRGMTTVGVITLGKAALTPIGRTGRGPTRGPSLMLGSGRF